MRPPRSRRPMRRPGMRPPRRPMRRGAWAPPPPELEAARGDVARAHELMSAGDYQAAEALFVRVAGLAAGHQRYRRAGHLYAQAAHAALEGGDVAGALAHAEKAMGVLVDGRDVPHAIRVVDRMGDELRGRGHEAEARALREKLDALLSEKGIDADAVRARAAARRAPKRELPAQCDACLGPVRSDDVEWIDETSAVCAYCGSVLKAV
jgi:tetratricopeptide (TPR) repeat protein